MVALAFLAFGVGLVCTAAQDPQPTASPGSEVAAEAPPLQRPKKFAPPTTREDAVANPTPPTEEPTPPELRRAPPPPPEPPSHATAPADANKTWVWGAYPERPRWKWAAFGTSLGVTVLGSSMAIASAAVSRGPLRKTLLETADASLADGNPSNDVDREGPGSTDLCAFARETGLDPQSPDGVRNAAVTRVCNRGDKLATIQLAGIGLAVVGAVSTAVFTTLLFVHRKGRGGRSQRDARVGASVLPGGGGSASVSMRF